jgi:hypothetical protein
MKPMPPRKPIGRQQSRLKPTTPVETPEDSLLDRIENELDSDGVKLFGNDNVDVDYLALPQDITETPSQELGRYLNAFTQQKMWTRTLIGRVSAMAKEERKKIDQIRDRVYSNLPVKMAVKEKELKLSNMDEAKDVQGKLDFYQQKLEILGDYLENIVDAIFNISREITRRNSDYDDENRVHNTGNKPTGRGYIR